MMSKMFNLLYSFKPIYRWSKLHQLEQKHAHNGFIKMAEEILDEKRGSKISDDKALFEDDDGYRRPKNFITSLLTSKHNLSEQEIKDEINTLIAAVIGTKLKFYMFICKYKTFLGP